MHDIVILGAGIAGIASAYYLKEQAPGLDILLLDKQQPLSLTSSCSGENFREFWPQPALNALSRDSIALMQSLLQEHGDDAFKLEFSGYEFVSHQAEGGTFSGEDITGDTFEILDFANEDVATPRQYLDKQIKRIIRASNAGQMDVHGLGSLLLKLARQRGVNYLQMGVQTIAKEQQSYRLQLDNNDSLQTRKLVLASGPFLSAHLQELDISLPIETIKQQKFVMPDPLQIIPRDMPFTIYADAQQLQWSDDEKQMLADSPDFAYLLQEFPAGLHIKPEGQAQIKLGWAFNRTAESPQWQVSTLDQFAEIVLRGASRFIPALAQYLEDKLPATIDYAGYYTRTPENLPLIGELDENLYCIGALAGFGTMCACGAGKLLSETVLQKDLPTYADSLAPSRYENASLMAEINRSAGDGQL